MAINLIGEVVDCVVIVRFPNQADKLSHFVAQDLALFYLSQIVDTLSILLLLIL